MFNLIDKNLIKKNISRNFLSVLFVIFIFSISIKAEAANLIFNPSLGNYYVGDTFKVSVLVDSQDIAINSVDSNINFSTDYLDVVSIDKISSIFPIWIAEPTYSNSLGAISFTGGLPTPGFTGASGKIMSITFIAKKAGIARINYSSGSVRANDGLGTDVLQSKGEGEYTIGIKSKETLPVVETKPTVALSPEILSVTHLDSEKWYSDRNPEFSWTFPNKFNAIRISYDENPDGLPTIFYSTTTSSMKFDNTRDGIYYLHLQARDQNGWSKISTFKFQIDTERPLNFDITDINKDVATRTQAEFTFNAKDELSGLDHFEINIDDSAPEIINNVIKQDYKTAVLGDGKHVIFIKVFDKAGNYAPSSLMFYTNISTVSTSTEKIINNIKELIGSIISSTKNYSQKFGSVINSQKGSVITKIITLAGLVVWAIMSVLASSSTLIASDIWLLLLKLFGLLLGAIGLKKKHSYWGVVYDSITKRPLDLVRVVLIDLDTGREVATTITDSDGRYSFLSLHGRYGIETRKTNYSSPSIKMKGKISDEVYDNLYFGGEIIITKEDEILTRNIPMDPMIFSWNAFIKIKPYLKASMREKNLEKTVAKISLIIGDIISILAVIFAPVSYNIIMVGIYTIVCLLVIICMRSPKTGELSEKNANAPLSFAIVKIFKEGEDKPFTKKVADKFGNYFDRVPAGKYYMTVEKKNDDESYTEVIHTTDIDVRDGIINFDIMI